MNERENPAEEDETVSGNEEIGKGSLGASRRAEWRSAVSSCFRSVSERFDSLLDRSTDYRTGISSNKGER